MILSGGRIIASAAEDLMEYKLYRALRLFGATLVLLALSAFLVL
jgi:hypothetical protein